MSKRQGSEFSKGDIEAMRLRVAARCSNPECRAQTTGPVTDPKKVCTLGQAAHIHAASSNGPRGKFEMSPAERKDISNGLWLCLPCARKIDLDPTAYSPELLLSWKRSAEKLAQLEISRPIPLQEVQLASAGISRNIPSMSVASAVEGMRQEIIRKDSRFNPEIKFDGAITHITMNVNENIECTLNLASEASSDFSLKMQALVEHGESLEMDASLLRLQGSPVFDDMSADGVFILEPANEKKAVFKVRFMDLDGNEVLCVDDIVGSVIIGTKSFKFVGSIFDGLWSLSVRKGMVGNLGLGDIEEIVKFSFDYERWLYKDVKNLPYFEKSLSLARVLSANLSSRWEMEIDGEVVLRMRQNGSTNDRPMMLRNFLLPYIDSVRKICSIIGFAAKFVETNISLKEIREAHMVASILTAEINKVESNFQNFLADVTPQSEQQVKLIYNLIESAVPHAVKIVKDFPIPIRIFDSFVKVESVTFFLSDAVVSNRSGGIVQKGEAMNLEICATSASSLMLQLAKGCKYAIIE